jgi:hypothetical protein
MNPFSYLNPFSYFASAPPPVIEVVSTPSFRERVLAGVSHYGTPVVDTFSNTLGTKVGGGIAALATTGLAAYGASQTSIPGKVWNSLPRIPRPWGSSTPNTPKPDAIAKATEKGAEVVSKAVEKVTDYSGLSKALVDPIKQATSGMRSALLGSTALGVTLAAPLVWVNSSMQAASKEKLLQHHHQFIRGNMITAGLATLAGASFWKFFINRSERKVVQELEEGLER